MTVYLSILHFW